MKRILLSTLALTITTVLFAQAPCSQLFFSEYVEGGGNNKALEIYNPTNQEVNLSRYHMARYRNGATVGDYVPFPTGTSIRPKSVLVVVLDKRDPNGTGQDTMVAIELQNLADLFLCPNYNVNPMMYFNGNDAVTLEDKINGAMYDIIGKIGEDPGYGWNNNPETGYTQPQWFDPNHWTYNNTMVRKPSVKVGITQNPQFFNPEIEWDTIGKDNFSNLRVHNCECGFNNIATPQLKNKLLVYPNPANQGYVIVHSSANISKIEIYNTIGQLVLRTETDGSMAKYTVDLNNINRGLYLVKVYNTDQSVSTRKLQVE